MKNCFAIFFLTLSVSIFSQQTVEDDFEGNGTIISWLGEGAGYQTDHLNPFKESINTSNTVLKYIDTGGEYANIRFDVPVNFDLSSENTFTLKMYVPSSGITGNQTNQISLKLQNGGLSESWTTQTEIIKTVVLDKWQILTFDFDTDIYSNFNPNSSLPKDRVDFNRVVIQINGENNTDKVVAYIDDFLYDGTIAVNLNSGENPVFDTLVWSDEFDGNGVIDSNKWFHQTIIPNGVTWFNNEIQHYTNSTANSFVDEGTLKIKAKKETYRDQGVTKNYTSARLNSKFAFTYGKVEIKAKMPFGVGTFPALWMLGQNITENGGFWAPTHGTTSWPACGEIDIIEHWGNNQNFVQSALHTPSSNGGTVNKGGRTIVGASTEFHIYSLEWSSNKLTFKVDGIVHYIYEPANKNLDNWPYVAPQFLLFNVAIQPDIDVNFTESAMEIDYVRVYQEATASLKEINDLQEVTLFPNPIEDKVTIQFSDEFEQAEVIIYNLLGQKIGSFIQNSNLKEYDFSNYKSGTYLIKIKTDKKISLHKMFKI